MSTDTPVIGITVVAGATSGAVSTLSNTGNPALVSLLVATFVLIVAGLLTKRIYKK